MTFNNIVEIHVDVVVFTDGQTLSDLDACVFNGFLIAEIENGVSWYNTDQIAELKGVRSLNGNAGNHRATWMRIG